MVKKTIEEALFKAFVSVMEDKGELTEAEKLKSKKERDAIYLENRKKSIDTLVVAMADAILDAIKSQIIVYISGLTHLGSPITGVFNYKINTDKNTLKADLKKAFILVMKETKSRDVSLSRLSKQLADAVIKAIESQDIKCSGLFGVPTLMPTVVVINDLTGCSVKIPNLKCNDIYENIRGAFSSVMKDEGLLEKNEKSKDKETVSVPVEADKEETEEAKYLEIRKKSITKLAGGLASAVINAIKSETISYSKMNVITTVPGTPPVVTKSEPKVMGVFNCSIN